MRGVLGAVAGFLVMLIVVMTGTALLVSYFAIPHGGSPTPNYLTANIVLSFLAAFGAGSVATAFGRPQTRIAVGILVALLLASTLISLTGDRAQQPVWYLAVVAAAGIGGILLGARVQGRRYAPGPSAS